MVVIGKTTSISMIGKGGFKEEVQNMKENNI